jgi:transcriptional regulator with XRE-family HTH domain
MEAQEIGRTLLEAREKMGYSRNALVHTKKLKGKITGEGLRKIEHGERIPHFENIRLLGDVLGLSEKRIKELEETAFEARVERIAKKTHRQKVTFQIKGRPIKLLTPQADKKMETSIRQSVSEMGKIVEKIGGSQQDVEYFTRHARNILYKHMSS